MPVSTRYANLEGDLLAYRVSGAGPTNLLYTSGGYSHIDMTLEEPSFAHFVGQLETFARVIRFDRRGSGASDPLPPQSLPHWESWVDDLTAVLDAAGLERAAVLAVLDAAPMALLFAALHPERVSALIVFNGTARYVQAENYPIGLPREQLQDLVSFLRENWGTETLTNAFIPSRASERAFSDWYARFQRACGTPRQVAGFLEQLVEIDVRHALPLIRVPTLVMHRAKFGLLPLEHGRYVAANIPRARFLEVPGSDATIYSEGSDAIVQHIEEFLTGSRALTSSSRILTTVLFTDIVGSTDAASTVGDSRWRQAVVRHFETARREIESIRGRLLETTGDGVVATFDGPGRAILCGSRILAAARNEDLTLRTGVHSGEVEVDESGGIGGIALHIASRVMAQARPNQLLVSRTVKDLVTGAGFSFRDEGTHHLKGLPDTWQLFSLIEGK